MPAAFDIVQQHDDRLSKLEDAVSDLKADIAACSANVTTLVTSIEKLSDRLEQLPERVTAVETHQKSTTKGVKFLGGLTTIVIGVVGLVLAFLGLK